MWPFIWRKMTSPYPRMLCAMFGWYWPNDSFIFVLFIHDNLSLEKGVTLRLNRYRFPLPKEALSSVRQFGWNRSSGSGEEDVYISSMYFSYFDITSPWKRTWPIIWTDPAPSTPKDALCKVWLKLVEWFGRRKWTCEKFTDRRTTCDQKSSLELSAQLSWDETKDPRVQVLTVTWVSETTPTFLLIHKALNDSHP